MPFGYQWRGEFRSLEVERLHAHAFPTRWGRTDDGRNWRDVVARHSLGWVVARDGRRLVGFVNVAWDGSAHAWIQDTVVTEEARHLGIGTEMINVARRECGKAGCEWLHVDFADDLEAFYVKSCGFTPTAAGLIHLEATSRHGGVAEPMISGRTPRRNE